MSVGSLGTCRQGRPGHRASLHCRPEHAQQAIGWHSVLLGTERASYHMGSRVRSVRLPYQSKRGSCTVVTFYYPQNCSARGSLPFFPSVLSPCCGSLWAHWVQAGLGTEGASLHRASSPAPWTDGWHSVLGHRVFTQGSLLAQRAWP